jgi:hypothetical protein
MNMHLAICAFIAENIRTGFLGMKNDTDNRFKECKAEEKLG